MAYLLFRTRGQFNNFGTAEPGRKVPRGRPKAALGEGARKGYTPVHWGLGLHPENFFELCM